MKLSEVTNPHVKIKQWLDSMKIENYTIRPSGVVDVNGDASILYFRGTTIPVQFGKVSGNFYGDDTNITSLQGSPQLVGGDFFCYNTKITSLRGAPQLVGGSFFCHSTEITSLHGINKIIEQINGTIICNTGVTHILGLLLIKGIESIDIRKDVDQIMNKYIGSGDIISAQDELIDAGYREQAKL